MKPIYEGWSPVMAVADFNCGNWSVSTIIPQGGLDIHPGAMATQFGASAFEGYKIFKSGNCYNIFRIRDNYARFLQTCNRLCIPCPSFECYFESLESLCRHANLQGKPFDSNWIYIRPIVLATDSHIMPIVSENYTFVILAAPIRQYEGGGLKLWVEDKFSRAAPGGLGYAKTAANYAHQFLPSTIAKQNGCDSVLWLDSQCHEYIEEGSTMNVFFRIDGDIHTPALTDTILAGITRSSVIDMLRNKNYRVIERPISIAEIKLLADSERLQEMFITATALGVGNVKSLFYRGEEIALSSADITSQEIKQEMLEIYQGNSSNWAHWVSTVEIEEVECLP